MEAAETLISDNHSKNVDLAKPKRPTRPATVDAAEHTETVKRPERPKSTRRARVLEPDQVAASRGKDYAPPSSRARDAQLGGEDARSTSKVGAVFQSFNEIVSGLKKSNAVDKTDDGAFSSKPESGAPKETGIGRVLANLSQLSTSIKSSKSAPIEGASESYAHEAMSLESSLKAQVVEFDDYDHMPEMDPTIILAKPSMMARFNTPLMGVLAAIALSFVGLAGSSVLFG